MHIDMHDTDKIHVNKKDVNTYVGIALIDEDGATVNQSLFRDSIRVGVGDTIQIKWNIDFIKEVQ